MSQKSSVPQAVKSVSQALMTNRQPRAVTRRIAIDVMPEIY